MRREVRFVLALAVLALGVAYLYSIRSQFFHLLDMRIGHVATLVACMVAFYASAGWIFTNLVGVLGTRLSLREAVSLGVLTNLANYISPLQAGAVVKAVYLKRTRNLRYAHFASVFVGNIFLVCLTHGTAGTALLLVQGSLGTAPPPVLVIMTLGMMILSILPFAARLPVLRRPCKLSESLSAALEGLTSMGARPWRLCAICAALFLQLLISGLMIYTTFLGLGTPVTFIGALTIGVFAAVSNLVSVTPSNLVLREAVTGYLVALHGPGFAMGVVGAGVIRLVHLFVTLMGAPLATHGLSRVTELAAAATPTGRLSSSDSSDSDRNAGVPGCLHGG